MVDYMTRTLRAAITNEVPNGEPFRLPQGVLGPKVLLDARSSAEGRDPQLERAVQEALRLVGRAGDSGGHASTVSTAVQKAGREVMTGPDGRIGSEGLILT